MHISVYVPRGRCERQRSYDADVTPAVARSVEYVAGIIAGEIADGIADFIAGMFAVFAGVLIFDGVVVAGMERWGRDEGDVAGDVAENIAGDVADFLPALPYLPVVSADVWAE